MKKGAKRLFASFHLDTHYNMQKTTDTASYSQLCWRIKNSWTLLPTSIWWKATQAGACCQLKHEEMEIGRASYLQPCYKKEQGEEEQRRNWSSSTLTHILPLSLSLPALFSFSFQNQGKRVTLRRKPTWVQSLTTKYARKNWSTIDAVQETAVSFFRKLYFYNKHKS